MSPIKTSLAFQMSVLEKLERGKMEADNAILNPYSNPNLAPFSPSYEPTAVAVLLYIFRIAFHT